jgi:predicted dehydrogenase
MSRPRIGIIGIKHMGREHYTNTLHMVTAGKAELVALCDIDETALVFPQVTHTVAEIDFMLANIKTIGMENRLPLLHEKMVQVCEVHPAVFTDYRKMMDEVELDGVIIVTPNFMHREMVEYALERNINVLSEKPLGTDSADCRAMIEADRKSEAMLQVGLHMRYRKLNNVVKELLDAGELGRISKIWCIEHRGDWHPNGTRVPDKNGNLTNWRYLQHATGGSIVEKLCHDFDLFSWWLGSKPTSVYATGGNAVYKDRETIDHADIIVRYENGVHLNVNLSMYAPNQRFQGRLMGVIGERGVLDHETRTSDFTIHYRDGSTREYTNVERATTQGYHPGNATVLELEAFLRCIETGEKPHADALVGLRSVMIGELAERSIQERREIEFSDWE